MTICVLFILSSKLVFCCAVLCDNFEYRGGREIGNMLDDKYLFIEICRSLVRLIVLGAFLYREEIRFF